MYQFKNALKRKESTTFDLNFKTEISHLDAMSIEKMRELILKAEKHCRKIESEMNKLQTENKIFYEDCLLFEEQQKLLAEANAELHNKLVDFEIIKDVSEVLQISFMNAIDKIGGKSFTSLTHKIRELKNAVQDFEEVILAKKIEVSKNELNSPILVEIFDSCSADLNHKFKVINSNVEIIDSGLEQLMKDFRNLYLTVSQHDEPKILEKYMMSDLLICSKKKLSSNTKMFSNLKKELTLQKTESVVLIKKTDVLEKENTELKSELKNLQIQCSELQVGLQSVSQLKNSSENEINGHVEVLRALQQEQFRLNVENQELKTKISELVIMIDSLASEKKILHEKLIEQNTQSVSIQRQDRLKLSQAKTDIQQLEEKIASTEKMLNAENKKYENLYSKYKELKEAHMKQLQNMDELKKLTKSFDGKTTDESEKQAKKHIDASISLNRSGCQNRISHLDFDGICYKTKEVEVAENIVEEIEDLKFKVLTTEFQLATERRILDEWVQSSETEKEDLNAVE